MSTILMSQCWPLAGMSPAQKAVLYNAFARHKKARRMWESEGTRRKAARRKGCGFVNSGPGLWWPGWDGASHAGNAPRAPVFHTHSGCRPTWKWDGSCPPGTTGADMKSPIKPRHRAEVFARDAWTCQYCGDSSLTPATATADHVIPAVAGGSHLPANLRTACRSCNCAKRHASLEDFRFLKTLGEAGLAHILSTPQAKALMQAGIDLKLPPAHVFFFEEPGHE